MRRLVLFAVLVLAACGGPPPEPPAPVPPLLAWETPRADSVRWLQGDTARVEVDAGGQTVEITLASRADLAMGFVPSEGGVRVTARYVDFLGSMSNPLTGSREITEEEIEGPLVFTLEPDGETSIHETPELASAAAGFVAPRSLARTFFPRFPVRAWAPGMTWTDTVTVDASSEGVQTASRSVIRYTAEGDTVVGGRTLLRVRMAGEDRRSVEGAMAGMDMTQDLSGSSEGWFLWDPALGLHTELVYRSDLTGTMEVSGAPFPLSVRVRSTARTALQEAAPVPPGEPG